MPLSALKVGELFHLVGHGPTCDDSDNYVPEWRVTRTGRVFYDVELKVSADANALALRPLRLSTSTQVRPLSRRTAEDGK